MLLPLNHSFELPCLVYVTLFSFEFYLTWLNFIMKIAVFFVWTYSYFRFKSFYMRLFIDGSPIKDAFSKMISKPASTVATPAAPKQVESQKKPISAADFFGSTPIQVGIRICQSCLRHQSLKPLYLVSCTPLKHFSP